MLNHFRESSSTTSGLTTPTPVSSTPHSNFKGLIQVKKKKKHTKSASTSSSGKPRQFNYYPPTWQRVLQDTKTLFHCSIASRNVFPLQDVRQREAGECIKEVVVEYEDQDVDLDPGKSLCSYAKAMVLTDVLLAAYEVNKDMKMLVRQVQSKTQFELHFKATRNFFQIPTSSL